MVSLSMINAYHRPGFSCSRFCHPASRRHVDCHYKASFQSTAGPPPHVRLQRRLFNPRRRRSGAAHAGVYALLCPLLSHVFAVPASLSCEVRRLINLDIASVWPPCTQAVKFLELLHQPETKHMMSHACSRDPPSASLSPLPAQWCAHGSPSPCTPTLFT